MATKHINDELWHRIEDLTVRANARQNLIRPVKEADVLHLVLQRGMELLTDDDLLQLGKYRRPIGFVLRRPGGEMLKLDTLSMADAVSILMRSGPATLCIWSRDNILRQASEDLIRERLPDAVVLSEGDGLARFQTMLPGIWNAPNRGEMVVISLEADSADHAIARITDLMCESLLGYKGQRAYRAGENEQGEES
ncbi:TPA: hypothetical protein PJH04_002885 [Escherichia coli]|nr:hypothetical protein [Escherichia coli]HDH7695276.1 hypothetical protein [Escherichia coli]HDU6604427.1 hypothetical protein [Escherichia coli]